MFLATPLTLLLIALSEKDYTLEPVHSTHQRATEGCGS